MKKIKRVIAPVRIDFAGGTTDIYPFTHSHGGAVLNAAINRYVVGELIANDKKVSLKYSGNIPTSSGLGTSGVMNLVWLALISKTKDKKTLANQVYKLEQSMGLVGGKQDQYAAAFGGINLMEFNKDKVLVKKLNLNKKFIRKLENKLVLVYTGSPHFSGDSNKQMIDNLIKGKNTKSLISIKKIALEMKNALLNNDLDEFSELMNNETKERKKLGKNIVSNHLQKFIDKGMKYSNSVKVCGSGGGGSLLFFSDEKDKLIKIFKNKVINFKFDFEGIRHLN